MWYQIMAGKLTFRQKLVAEKSKNYKLLRRVEYPSIEDQLDMLYWDNINGTTTWQDAITEIKSKYPKDDKVVVTIKSKRSRKRKK